MKKKTRQIMGLLLAFVMACLPAAQVFAETSYSAAGNLEGQILFPKDSLTDIVGNIQVGDGEPYAPEGGGWQNSDEARAVKAVTQEDGTIQIKEAGYVLVVEGGTSGKKDDFENTSNHYQFGDWEKPEKSTDIAYYKEGDTVKLVADPPAEGMEFAGWKCDQEGVKLEDASSPETTFTMINKKVTVTAQYQEKAPQTYTVSVENGTGGGSYEEGSWVTVQANDRTSENLEFTGWSISNEGVALDTSTWMAAGFTMPAGDVTVAAQYQEMAPQTYTVNVENGTGGGSYEEGSWVTVQANDRTSENLEFTGWSISNEGVALDTSTWMAAGFTMPSGDVTVAAQYQEMAPQTYTVSVENGTGGGEFAAGAEVTVTANDPGEGSAFAGWFSEEGDVSFTAPFDMTTTFTMPDRNVIVAATYEETEPETDPAVEPETAAPETDPAVEPETAAPETDPAVEPETTAPETDPAVEPETTAPETDPAVEPETAAPETSPAAETEATAPETGAPDPAAEPASVAETATSESDIVIEPQGSGTDVTLETSAPAAAEPASVPETPAPAQSETPAAETSQTEEKFDVVVENGIGTGAYAAGDVVTVEAADPAEEGQIFDSWQTSSSNVILDDATQGVATFVMPAESVTLTATYAAAKYTVTLESGTSDVTEAEAGQNVTVTASDRSGEGLVFDHWEGIALVNGAESSLIFQDANASSTVFTMQAGAASVKAVYQAEVKTYHVKVSNGLINDTSTELDVEENTAIYVTANASPTGQAFSNWKVNDGQYDLGDAAYNTRLELTVTEDMEILAEYEGIQYTVSVENGDSDYDECVGGTVVTITADEAPEGYEFDSWSVTSGSVSLADASEETTLFTMPYENVSVKANYKRVAYALTVENGSSGADLYYAGDTVTVSSNYPASGREFNTWVSVSGTVTFADASRWKTTFTMPASDVTVRATYKDGPSTDDNKILELISGGEYYIGDTIKFTASGAGMDNSNPNPGDYRYRPTGYQIGNVTGTWQASPYTTSMAIKAAGEYTLKVSFSKDVFNGTNWVADGTTDSKSVTFRVISRAAGVATGDDTPILAVVAVAVVACVLFIVLLVLFIKKRRR